MGKNRYYCCFHLGKLNDNTFGKELFIRFTVRVLRERLSNCKKNTKLMRFGYISDTLEPFFPFWFRERVVGFDCINS